MFMSRVTGADITDVEDLEQSIVDILTTPLGTRVAVRDYGCELPFIVDGTISRQWVTDAFYYVAAALARWEPRYQIYKVSLDCTYISQGIIAITLTGLYTPLGRIIVLENVTLNFSVAEASNG